MMIAAYYCVVVLLGLFMFGSEGAWHDEVISRIALFVALLSAVPVVYAVHFIRAPALLSAEDQLERNDILGRLAEADNRKESPPEPEFYVIQSSDGAKFEIFNHNVDADFTVKIDFRGCGMYALPSFPVLAQWVDMQTYPSQRIEAETSNRVILFRSEDHDSAPARKLRFFWVLGFKQQNLHSSSWIVANNFGGTIPPQGTIRLIISSSPPMAGGTRIFDIEFMADKVRLDHIIIK